AFLPKDDLAQPSYLSQYHPNLVRASDAHLKPSVCKQGLLGRQSRNLTLAFLSVNRRSNLRKDSSLGLGPHVRGDRRRRAVAAPGPQQLASPSEILYGILIGSVTR